MRGSVPPSEGRALRAVEPFTIPVAKWYARELAQTLAREKTSKELRQAEIRDFAKLVAVVYRKQKQDWTPARAKE